MGDENYIRTLGDYFKPSHDGYKNTIELPVGNNMALDDFDSRLEKRLSSLRTQLGQQQDDMIRKINLLWKILSEKLNDAPNSESAGNFMASKNIASISHIEREELRRKGIKFLPSYSPQRETTTDITPEHGYNITKKAKEEVKEVIDEEESEVETDEEVEEILKDEEEDEDDEYFNSFPTIEELTHHGWLLKNPRPS
nr:hypothetical protein [Tanacetum cinerariifolium]